MVGVFIVIWMRRRLIKIVLRLFVMVVGRLIVVIERLIVEISRYQEYRKWLVEACEKEIFDAENCCRLTF